MDSCQLIRKETKVEVAHLNQKQLAARWSISEATLERWRSEGIGPKFLKLCGRVLYRQVDIEAYEESCLATSTKTVTAQVSAS
jgi:predicted site-specific integrase-resolvase